ncbi:MAG: hypothetical protein QM773_15700 [Hyphomonadaceae bacterium]
MAVLEKFLDAMSGADAPKTPNDVARLLGVCVQRACSDLDLTEAEVFSDGPMVTMFPTQESAWEAVVVGADAYQLYPGVLKEDGETIVWANVWVGENYSLAKFVDVLEQELSRAAG